LLAIIAALFMGAEETKIEPEKSENLEKAKS
jgi:hypothetical protein